MTYAKRDGGPLWSRVVEVSGAYRLCSTGTAHAPTANAVEAWHKGIRSRLDPLGVLAAIVDGRITLSEAFALGEAGTVARLAALSHAATRIDLSAELAPWRAAVARQRRGRTADEYLRQVERLYPERPLYVEALTPVEIARRLDTLTASRRLESTPASSGTRNRYRAALSSWCKHLTRRGLLTVNPVRDVESDSEPDSPMRWQTPENTLRILRALVTIAPQGAAAEALMAGGGLELSAITRCQPADVRLDALTAHARGTKRTHRDRVVRLRPWVREFVAPYWDTLADDAPLAFAGYTQDRASRWHDKALAACELPHCTLHDWRHTHAVQLLQDGEHPDAVRNQLGLKTTALVWARYGRFIVDLQHYRVLGVPDSSTRLSPAATPATGAH
jgi:integrase